MPLGVYYVLALSMGKKTEIESEGARHTHPRARAVALHTCSVGPARLRPPSHLTTAPMLLRRSLTQTMLKAKKGKLAVKYNHQKHSDAAQHNLTNRRIEAAVDEPEQEDSKEDDGAEDAEAPTSAVDEPMPEDAKEEDNAKEEGIEPMQEDDKEEAPGAQAPDDKADEVVPSQR